jgi:hypothetical protein
MQIIQNSAATRSDHRTEPAVYLQRIGSTRFLVNVHFCKVASETAEDKILRLIEREVRNAA